MRSNKLTMLSRRIEIAAEEVERLWVIRVADEIVTLPRDRVIAVMKRIQQLNLTGAADPAWRADLKSSVLLAVAELEPEFATRVAEKFGLSIELPQPTPTER
jgi:hypothetical protein